jgi:hypothetical protein
MQKLIFTACFKIFVLLLPGINALFENNLSCLFRLRKFIAAAQVTLDQGDQIGRIFAYWVTVDSGQFFENYRRRRNFKTTFFRGKSYALVCQKNVLGYILGDFSTKSSGHPALDLKLPRLHGNAIG